MPTNYAAEAKKMIPAMAGCYDCNWTAKGTGCRDAAEKHREEQPTHWIWYELTPTGTEITGAHEQIAPDYGC